MSDFRKDLYERYVSTFKSRQLDDRALATQYQWYGEKYLPLIKKFAGDSSILELGCGPGHLLTYLAEAGFTNVTGIDISAEQIALAKSKALNVQVADVFEYLEKSSNKFDVILAIDFAEHFSKNELLRLFQIIHTALNDGGTLILQTPNGQGLFPHQVIYSDLTHMTILTPFSLEQLLRFIGFREIEFHETGPARSIPKHVPRFIVWQIIKLAANIVRMVETGKRQSVWTENMICKCKK